MLPSPLMEPHTGPGCLEASSQGSPHIQLAAVTQGKALGSATRTPVELIDRDKAGVKHQTGQVTTGHNTDPVPHDHVTQGPLGKDTPAGRA